MKKRIISVLLILIFTLLLSTSFTNKVLGENIDIKDDHDLLTDFNAVEESEFVNYTYVRENKANLSNIVNEKIIMFTDAIELYEWSQDLSYSSTFYSSAQKQTLVSGASNYTLGTDIDYTDMKARKFMPIGYSIGVDSLQFSGTFDGRGFEIKGLYYESFSNYYTIIDESTIPYSAYFSMFNYSMGGTIKNFGLIDPIIDLENEHAALKHISYIVGHNHGSLLNVYIEDTRSYGNAGMRVFSLATGVDSQKSAGGLVNYNTGFVYNSYFTGVSVVHADFMHAVLEEPIIYNEGGQMLFPSYYDSTRYGLGVPQGLINTPTVGTPITSANLKNGTGAMATDFSYYPNDGYPKLYSLSKNSNDEYLINTPRDFITFSKLLTLSSEAYNEATYLVMNDLNMDDVSRFAFNISNTPFDGILKGNGFMPQINNLKLTEGIIIGDGYYLGLFPYLTGEVRNLRFYNYEIYPTTDEDYVGQTFYIAGIAPKLEGGLVKDVSMNINIDLTNEHFKVGSYVIGSIAGEASGHIERIYLDKRIVDDNELYSIDLSNMEYSNAEYLNHNFYLGSAVGKTGSSKLVLYNILNKSNIKNLEASTSLYTQANNPINFHVGGIIGNANNTNTVKHNFGLLTNEGKLSSKSNSSARSINTYLGGVVGLSSGSSYEFSDIFGKFTNEGIFDYNNNSGKTLYVAGVLNSNHSEAAEYVQIYSASSLIINQSGITSSPLINHLSNTKLTVSQAEAKGSVTYSGAQKNVHGAIYTSSNSELILNFINVETNYDVLYNTVSNELRIAGVTLNQNANYLNVVYGGELKVNIKGITNIVWISGITRQLSANKLMKNALNEGSIKVHAETTNTTNSTIKNVYIAGLVNYNLSGDLHTNSSNIPVATQGIINSINRANMTSHFDGNSGFSGRLNIFAGGITTINNGSIQNASNIGNIRFSNITSGIQSQFISINNNVYEGGKTEMFKTGVVSGGISSVVASGHSRIYDVINSGNILAQSYYYARSGGILGIVSPFDVSAGDVSGFTVDHDVSKTTHLKHSVISNGINYGNISAITSVIGTYTSNNAGPWFGTEGIHTNMTGDDRASVNNGPSINMQTRSSSVDRIAIHSAAGGIIGSGLSVLKRMINHGDIYATDAAGGIIGSIFVFVERVWSVNPSNTADSGVTMVNINTAINYGNIKAVKIHSSGTNNFYFNAINNSVDGNINNISNVFYAKDDNFIIPTSPRNTATNSVRMFPEHKRGFGGIIGRIQRGGNQYMVTNYVGFGRGPNLSSEEGSFDFIVNMNEDIDLIGRLDQNYNFSLSGQTFQFYDAIYYSAKQNDMTQAVFTGFYLQESYRMNSLSSGNNAVYFVPNTTTNEITQSGNNYVVPSNKTVYNQVTKYDIYHQVGQRYVPMSKELQVELGFDEYTGNSTTTRSFSRNTYTMTQEASGVLFVSSSLNKGTVTRTFQGVRKVPYITETPSNNSKTYAYHEDFVMRDENTKLTTGESITSYIYYAEKDLLADRLQVPRPNGMYVLSTTAGSTFGSVLPRNISVNTLQKLDKDIPNNINYNQVSEEYYKTDDPKFTDLITIYSEDLYQTKLNDKSDLLEDDQKVIAEDSNIGKIYYDGFVQEDFDNNKITFDVTRDQLGSNYSLNLSLLDVEIPANALIARDKRSNETWEQFQEKLLLFRNNNPGVKIATGDLAPSLSNTTSPVVNNSPYYIGDFYSYSEAAVYDGTFTQNYRTKYELYVKYSSSSSTKPSGYRFKADNGSFVNINSTVNNFNNEFTIRFIDAGDLLPKGYLIDDYLNLYYVDSSGDILVNREYYQIISIPKNGTEFDTQIVFSENLRNGSYKLGYKFFEVEQDNKNVINLSHNRTRNHEILNFKPYTNKTTIGNISDIRFGYDLFADKGDSFTENTYSNVPYLARYNYIVDFLDNFQATPFFEIEDIDITSTVVGGYNEYEVKFNLKDGSEVIKIIKEASLSPTYYKDNVRLATKDDNGSLLPSYAETFVLRERDLTTFSLVYNMEETYYDVNNFRIKYKNLATNDIEDITTSSNNIYYGINNNKLNIYFKKELIPGNYEVYVEFTRDGSNYINAGNLVINKEKGTKAYLTGIKFSEFVSGIEYPEVYKVNNTNTTIDENKQLGVYYLGIDYDNTDKEGHKYFRIDGKVAGIPLNHYMPIQITDYLPLGAKIQRRQYIGGVPSWTTLVNGEDDPSLIDQSLSTDFTLDPVTGELMMDGNGNAILPYIEYRVVAENDIGGNENNGIIYFISARDIRYSFLAIFDYQYFTGTHYYPIYDEGDVHGGSPFVDKTLYLDIYNYDVKNNGVLLTDNYVAPNISSMPVFDEIVETNSRLTQLYYVNKDTVNSYIYGLGNNFSGFYHFKMDLPKGYTYEIYEGEVVNANKLKTMSTNINGMEGFYYYINASPITRTRYFTIVIKEGTSAEDGSWGITDDKNSFID